MSDMPDLSETEGLPIGINSKETEPIRTAIGGLMLSLEGAADAIYKGSTNVLPGLDIRQLPEYGPALFALGVLREAAARGYHEQNRIPIPPHIPLAGRSSPTEQPSP